jgi:hypothetical protein
MSEPHFFRSKATPLLLIGVGLEILIALLMSSVAGAYATVAPEPVYSSARGLPDGRVYEQVSPTNKYGNYTDDALGYTTPDGESILYRGSGPLASSSTQGNPFTSIYVATHTNHGWISRSALPIGAPGPQQNPEENRGGPEASMYWWEPSPDLSHIAFSLHGPAYVGSPDEYGLADNFYLAGPDPLSTPEWLSRSNPAGGGAVYPVGGSPDFSTFYFESSGLLGQSASGFYEYRDGVLSDVGALPAGAVSSARALPANEEGGEVSGSPAELSGNNPVSADGSRAFFRRATETGATELYVHITATDGTGSSILVSGSALSGHGGEPAPDGVSPVPSTEWTTGASGDGGGPSTYMYASPDGDHVFFESEDRLTDAAPLGPGPKTYEFTVDTGALEYLPNVVGTVITSDADGSSFLFEDTSRSPAEVSRWKEGQGGGTVTPIAQLPVPRGGSTCGIICVGPAHMSQGGTVAVFSTESPISGFNDVGDEEQLRGSSETGTAVGNVKEIFRFESNNNKLSCISCPPRGQLPTGSAIISNLDKFANQIGVSGGSGSFEVSDERNESSEDNRVFFDAPDSLVPQDITTSPTLPILVRTGSVLEDEGRDVYEWEGGTVYLISSGTSQQGSLLLDSSESGDDVFFTTTDGLTAGDTDGARDVYDARVPRPGDNEPPSRVPCEGEVCQGPASIPQLLGEPPSATFNGVGNVTPARTAPRKATPKVKPKPKKCAKGSKHVRGKCVKTRRGTAGRPRVHAKKSRKR